MTFFTRIPCVDTKGVLLGEHAALVLNTRRSLHELNAKNLKVVLLIPSQLDNKKLFDVDRGICRTRS